MVFLYISSLSSWVDPFGTFLKAKSPRLCWGFAFSEGFGGLTRKGRDQGSGIRDQGSEKVEHGGKGADGMGSGDGTGVLRCAQDDSRNKQRQRREQAAAKAKADSLRG